MSVEFVPVDRTTPFLLPASMQEWLPEDHLARFVVEIVDRLDLSRLEASYAGRGSRAYHPAMLTTLLLYGYATGTFSSRKLEAATYDSIAVRYICANAHPDHDTIAAFRSRFLDHLKEVFVQVLVVAREMGMLKLGTVSLDGTKVKANASKHKALSYGHASKLEAQLQEEVATLLRMADECDQQEADHRLDFPAEIQRRSDRLAAIAAAKARIEQRHRKEQAASQHSGSDHRPDDDDTVPPPPSVASEPPAKAQVNLTDAQSRIMPTSGGGWMQAYNAQALVDVSSHLIVGTFLTQSSNDKRQITPALVVIKQLPKKLGRVKRLLGDNGYHSNGNVEEVVAAKITPLLALGRDKHNLSLEQRLMPPEPLGEDATAMQRMMHLLRTPNGRALYGQRKSTVEPVFGIIKHVLGFGQFSLRGVAKATAEWALVATAWNLKRMCRLAAR